MGQDEQIDDGLTEEERKLREERLKPRGLNEKEKAELMILFEKRRAISFATLQTKQSLKAGVPEPKKGQKIKKITFELLGVQTFGMLSNFAFSEEFLHYLHNHWLVSYDKGTKLWVFTPLEIYHHVFAHCRERFIGKSVDVVPIPPFAMTVMENPPPFSDRTVNKMLHKYNFALDREHKPRISQLPTKLYRQLYNFQKVGVQFAIDQWGRILLGDEMGVGKTIQAISISYLYRKDWPVLVIVPSSLRYSWRDEIYKWLDGYIPDGAVQVISKNTDDIDMSCSYIIVSYSLAQKLAELIDKLKFQIVIADEAHYLKSRESKRSRSLVPILTKIKRCLLLTGTPMLGKPNEIFNLIKILRPDIFIKFLDFGVRYCCPKEGPYGIDWSGHSNNRELHLLLEKALMIRRLKSEVLQELPSKRRQKVSLPVDKRMTNKIQILLSKVKKFESKLQEDINELQVTLYKGGDVDQEMLEKMSQKHSSLLQAYAMSGQAKAKGVFAFIETLIDSQVKFLVFAHHYAVLDQLEDQMLKSKINYIRIDGRIDVKKRYDAVKKFQNDPKCMVAVLSLTASSQGITLTAAQCVVFAEMHWTPGIMIQAEDRAHRIGQASSVTVYYLYGEDTIDSLIYPRLRLKSEVIANVIDGKGDDETFKIQETRIVTNLKLYDKIETPPPFVPYKNFNNFYDQPNFVDYKKYKQIQYMKRKQAEREAEEKEKKDLGVVPGEEINQEELNNCADKVVEKGFDRKYDLEQETDSEEHEYGEETDIAMPVIQSLVEYENKYIAKNENDPHTGKKHSEKYEKQNTNNTIVQVPLDNECVAENRNMQQMNVTDFFFFKPQDLSKKKHFAEIGGQNSYANYSNTNGCLQRFDEDLEMKDQIHPQHHQQTHSFQSQEKSENSKEAPCEYEVNQRIILGADNCDHNSQEIPFPEPPIAPKNPDQKYIRRLMRRKLRKTNPALLDSLTIQATTTQQTQSVIAPSQLMINTQLFPQPDVLQGVTSISQNLGQIILQPASAGATMIESKSQLLPLCNPVVQCLNLPDNQDNFNDNDAMGLSDAICEEPITIVPDKTTTQIMEVQVNDMNSNLIDQKIAEAEASLLQAIANETGSNPDEDDEEDEGQIDNPDDLEELRRATTDVQCAKVREEDIDDNEIESDGMSIKWKAFALLRKQFNRIDRQKTAQVENRTPQSTMSMMLADFNAVNRFEKQQYLMYLYQMKRRRYYLNGLKMQQANKELIDRLQRREEFKKQRDSSEGQSAQGTQQTYLEGEHQNSSLKDLKAQEDEKLKIDQQRQENKIIVKSDRLNSRISSHNQPSQFHYQNQYQQNQYNGGIKSQMTNQSFLVENESNMTTGFLQEVAARIQTQSYHHKHPNPNLTQVYDENHLPPPPPGSINQTVINSNELPPNDEEIKSETSEEKNARMLNEQFMDGMTQMPEDEEINETMSRIAAEDIVDKKEVKGKPTPAVEMITIEDKQMVDKKAEGVLLSQSLLETFEMMEFDDQFENLLDDVQVNNQDAVEQQPTYIIEANGKSIKQQQLQHQNNLRNAAMSPLQEKQKCKPSEKSGSRPIEKNEIAQPMPALSHFMQDNNNNNNDSNSNVDQNNNCQSVQQSQIKFSKNHNYTNSNKISEEKAKSNQLQTQPTKVAGAAGDGAISCIADVEFPSQISLLNLLDATATQATQAVVAVSQASSTANKQTVVQTTPHAFGFKFGKARPKLVKRKRR